MKNGKTYSPKAIKGVSINGYTKINIRQLRRLYDKRINYSFSGFLVGNKVNSFHFFDGWALAYTLKNKSLKETIACIDSMQWYLEPELGNRIAIFVENNTI